MGRISRALEVYTPLPFRHPVGQVSRRANTEPGFKRLLKETNQIKKNY